jgi:enamine deaminase RidA (YjgF/YER057c/UK114 family)
MPAGTETRATEGMARAPHPVVIRKPMTRRRISSGSSLEADNGYSRAIVDGEWCFVAGTTGYDYAAMTVAGPALDQARATFANIRRALDQAGFAMADVVRATYYVTEAAYAAEIAPAIREALGEVRPAATLVVVAGLIAPELKVEIEVTAKKRAD